MMKFLSKHAKSYFLKPIFFLAILLFQIPMQAQDVTLMTYNIRLDHESDGEDQWPNRKEFLTGQIKFYEPMIFGVQEALPHQMDYLQKELSQYQSIGVGRDDGKREGEFSALFYQKDLFELMESGTFWLSETPDKPSKGWDAAINRICTWGLFRMRQSDQMILVMNTHFDHVGVIARQKSLELIDQKAKEINPENYPLVVMGDLNLEPDSEPIKWFQEKMDDSRVVSGSKAFGPEGTFNGWKTDEIVTRRIDYIFLSPYDFAVKKYAVISDYVNLHYPSDHFPVYVKAYINLKCN